MIYVILTLSIAINILLIWYGYRLIKKLFFYGDSIDFLLDDVGGVVAHLEAIYELTTFHGDETLENLLRHSKRLKEDIEEFKQNCLLEVEEKKELTEYEEEGEEETARSEGRNKTVLYSNT